MRIQLSRLLTLLKPDWPAIVQALYAHLIIIVVPSVVVFVAAWALRFDPLNLREKLLPILLIPPYVLMAIGAGTICYLLLKLWHRLRPPVRLAFSMHLDKAAKGQNITGIGRAFLKRIKSSPPFLGISASDEVLPAEHEKWLTAYFRALDFVKGNADLIRGGGTYRCKSNDTWESIAESEYGDKRFAHYLREANPGSITPPPQGSHVRRPRLDVSETLGLSPALIEGKYELAANKDGLMNDTFAYLTHDLHLVYDEALTLLRMIYDAAQLV